jgi:hypothetical protein
VLAPVCHQAVVLARATARGGEVVSPVSQRSLTMSDDDLLVRVSRLRGEGKSPKQIARALGLAPSVVAPLVRAVAAEAKAAEGAPAVVGCWVNAGWSAGLGVDPSRGWVDEASTAGSLGGLVAVLVARRHRYDRVSVCGYLLAEIRVRTAGT